jgi:hypothetical protein
MCSPNAFPKNRLRVGRGLRKLSKTRSLRVEQYMEFEYVLVIQITLIRSSDYCSNARYDVRVQSRIFMYGFCRTSEVMHCVPLHALHVAMLDHRL